jgi:hypothetical protein
MVVNPFSAHMRYSGYWWECNWPLMGGGWWWWWVPVYVLCVWVERYGWGREGRGGGNDFACNIYWYFCLQALGAPFVLSSIVISLGLLKGESLDTIKNNLYRVRKSCCLTHFLPRTSACSFAEFYSVDRARTHARLLHVRTFLLFQTALPISFELN